MQDVFFMFMELSEMWMTLQAEGLFQIADSQSTTHMTVLFRQSEPSLATASPDSLA